MFFSKNNQKYYYTSSSYLILFCLFFLNNVHAQFADSSGTSDSDCDKFCSGDCHEYFHSGGDEFSRCVSAKFDCNCNLTNALWGVGTAIFVIFGVIVGVIICCGVYRVLQHTCGGGGFGYGGPSNYRGIQSPAPRYSTPGSNGNFTTVHQVTHYPPQRNTTHFGLPITTNYSPQSVHNNYPSRPAGFISNFGTGTQFGDTPAQQPPFNPSFSNNFNVNPPAAATAPGLADMYTPTDAPPSYEDIAKQNRQ